MLSNANLLKSTDYYINAKFNVTTFYLPHRKKRRSQSFMVNIEVSRLTEIPRVKKVCVLVSRNIGKTFQFWDNGYDFINQYAKLP